MTTNARPRPAGDRPVARTPPGPPRWRRLLIPVGGVIAVLLLVSPSLLATSPTKVGYGQLNQQIMQRKVEELTLASDGTITGIYRPAFDHGAAFASHYPTGVGGADPMFLADIKNPALVSHFQATGAGGSLLGTLLSFLPLLLFVAYFFYIGRMARRSLGAVGGAGGVLGIGRSRARIIDTERPDTTFDDVAGYAQVKQEIGEVADFLRNPGRYAAAGAAGPKGVLMAGPPGTGKTLLARAIAGEADVPFLSVTGSSFVELFAGVGASRVRDLFAEARQRSPAIIFIDEIDALGQRRGGGLGINDEREQAPNQMLAEMDGFDPATGVVVIAATNRPEILDPALLRPGRLDRHVVVPLPNQEERAAILAVHTRGKHLAADVDLTVTARGTPGFSGADLANLVNEAAIRAIRDDRFETTAADLSAARDRVLLGQRHPAGFLLDSERHNVAVHESGHALVAMLSPAADPVEKVTILPSGMALGATQQLPKAEQHLLTELQLTTQLAVMLGGRAAELVVFGQGSTGASSDLSSATGLAARMVREFGLSPSLGPVGYGEDSLEYLDDSPLTRRGYSEATQRVIDEEVSRLLREAEDTAVKLLTRNRAMLDDLTVHLLQHETVDGQTVRSIIGKYLADGRSAGKASRRADAAG